MTMEHGGDNEGEQSTYNVANNWGPLARKLCLENKYFSSIMDKCIGDCFMPLRLNVFIVMRWMEAG